MTQRSFEQHFPFDCMRSEQRQAIEFILRSFLDENKKFVVCELGTGVGKSAIGVTVSRYLSANPTGDGDSSSYVLTTQKVLQDQYDKDFGPKSRKLLQSIKSSSNYKCSFYSDQSCGESRRMLHRLKKQLNGTEFFKRCTTKCAYSLDKHCFIDSPVSVTNFAYFLAETMYAKQLEPRGLLVIDEAHTIESELSKFIEVTFSEKFAKDVLKCKSPPVAASQAKVLAWVKGPYKSSLQKHIASIEQAIEQVLSAEMSGLIELGKQYELLDKHICKVNRFIEKYKPEQWIMNTIDPQKEAKRAGRKFEFKTIDVSNFSEETLFSFGDRCLMLSATILDKDVFCRAIGIDPKSVAFLSMPSPFPIENKPIHYIPVGKMSINKIDETLPKMVEVIKMLLEQHPNDKGIVHCVSFKVAKYIKENIASNRLLVHTSSDRDDVLRKHKSSSEPTVLLSPSMMEGIDLADDASRFQILCKVPFPNLGDLVVQKRKERDAMWYPYQTAKMVIQSMGRSIRNETDHAVSYILDEDWGFFYARNSHMFPPEFAATRR